MAALFGLVHVGCIASRPTKGGSTNMTLIDENDLRELNLDDLHSKLERGFIGSGLASSQKRLEELGFRCEIKTVSEKDMKAHLATTGSFTAGEHLVAARAVKDGFVMTRLLYVYLATDEFDIVRRIVASQTYDGF